MSYSPRLIAAFLFASLSVACGGSGSNSGSALTHAAVSQYAVATPELPGTPMAVCPRLGVTGLVASSYAVEGGFALEVGTLDAEFAERLREQAEGYVERQRVLEEAFQYVISEKRDDGNGVYIRFSHDEEDVLNEVHGILERGVLKRPAAARRVSFRIGEGYVDMQLPNGGPLITAKTNEAARDTVKKWTDREPTGLDFESTEVGFKLEILSSDEERLDDLRGDVIDVLFLCPEGD